MGELTREEVTARLEAFEARIDARAQATDSKIDALKNEMVAQARVTDSKIDALKHYMESLHHRMDAKVHKGFVDLIKWMVGTAIALAAIGVTLIIFLFSNVIPRQPAPAGLSPPVTAPAPAR